MLLNEPQKFDEDQGTKKVLLAHVSILQMVDSEEPSYFLLVDMVV